MSRTPSALKSQIIQAGAGAGKTTRLIQTFLDFVQSYRQQHEVYPRVVISTFTKKATQELKERLFKKAIEMQDEGLLKFISRPSSVHISTLHGLLVPFLARFGNRCGLNSEIRVISDYQKIISDKRICKRLFQKNPDLVSLLDFYNWHELMIGLDIYVQARLQNGEFQFDSYDRLQLWMTESFQAWSEKRRSLQLDFQSETLSSAWKEFLDLFFCHAQNWNELRPHFDRLPRKPSHKSLSPGLDDRLKLLRDEAFELLEHPFMQEERQKEFDQLQKQFQRLAELFFKETIQHKFEKGHLSMADLETLTLEVIRQDPSAATSFSKDWNYWMIDEYQDTSPIQVEILKAFMQESPHFIVGDPQQSIYLFRGARREVFENKIKEMESLGIPLQRLEFNYRSCPELVNFYNEFFKVLSTDFVSMQPQRPALGTVAVKLVSVPEVEDQEDSEIRVLLAHIQKLIQSGVAPQKVAVLSRTNSRLKVAMTMAQKLGLDVECPSLSDYWKRREVLDLACLLQFLLNPFDNHNLFQLLRSPWFFVSDQNLLNLTNKDFFWKQLAQIPEAQVPQKFLQSLLDFCSLWGLSATLLQFIQQSDFLWSSQLIDASGRREANIWKFLNELRDIEKRPGLNVLEWLDEVLADDLVDVDLSTGEAPPLLQPSRISLMTIHASKGLEFDHVFLLGLSDRPRKSNNEVFCFDPKISTMSVSLRDSEGKWMYSPLTQSRRDEMRLRESEESLRWLYVAMTRAKESLTLITKEKFDSQSWWAQWPLPKEVGLHRVGTCQYSVTSESPQDLMPFHNSKEQAQVIAPYSWRAPAVMEKTSVTELVESEKSLSPSTDRKENSVQALKKAQLGTHLHRIFESLALGQRPSQLPPEWAASVEFLEKLQVPPMQQIFQKGHPEWGFAVQMHGKLLQGAIDMWAELPGAVYILDYKTGSSRYQDKAISQLKIYSDALKQMKMVTEKKPHKLVALYPLEKKVVIHDLL